MPNYSRLNSKTGIAFILLILSILSFPQVLNAVVPPANASTTSFSFAASGDMGSLTVSTSTSSMTRLVSANPNFFLGLGDLSYDPTVQGDLWCSQFKSQFNNIEILPGDHDTGGHSSTSFGETHNYDKYVAGCPLTLGVPINCGPIEGACYGKEYYFDYPSGNPIARFIFASPKIYNITGVCVGSPNCSSQTGQPCTDQYGCWPYAAGDIHYNFVSNAIDDAHSKGIRWVIAATHKLCISSSDATCSMGNAFFNMLLQKKVDLIIQAHDNAYERSKQLALNQFTGCTSIKNDNNGYAVYNAGCVDDDGSRGYYSPGAGSVVVVQGAWINDLYTVNNTAANGGANAAEAPYFVKLMGSNTLGAGLGFVQYTVSSNRIDVATHFSGTYSDSFSIWAGPNPVPSITWSPLAPQVGQSVTFTAAASGGVAPYSFSWDFGDGAKATGTTTTHTYSLAEYYNVTLTSTDSTNKTGSTRNVIAIGSWNSAIQCSPTVSTIEKVIGNVAVQRNASDPNSVGADYGGGGFKLAGPTGSNPVTWPFSKRSLQPPCIVSGISSFVELHNVMLNAPALLATYDCRTSYDEANGAAPFPNGKNCDITFSIGNPSFTTCPACYMHQIYVEIDGDWNASGIAPASPPTGQLIDIQGFVYWDTSALTTASHNWSGWEIHAVSAWRLSPGSISPPTVNVGSPTPNPDNTGSTVNVQFSVSSSTTVTGINVNWGDGTASDNLAGTATSDSHVYTSTSSAKSKSFTITVTATNSAGSGSGTTSETVNDRAPTVTISSISPNPVNTQTTVTASFSSSDPDGTISSITVNWGDGSAIDNLAGTATSDIHSYSSAGTFTVTVTVTDNSGSTGQAIGSETVQAPKAPVVTVNNPSPNPANTRTSVSVSFNVTSSSQVTGIAVNWGDGTTDSLPGTATSDSHTYTSTGSLSSQTFTITVTATNKAGPGSGITTETINDRPPTVNISSVSPNPALTGSIVTVMFSATDPDGTISSFIVAWGDGSTTSLAGTATSATHSYASTGNSLSQSFTITVSGSDNGGSTGFASSSVTVNDRVPSVNVSSVSPNPASTGQIVTVGFSSADPDGTVSSIVINWGDGSTTNLSGSTTSASHTYSSTGASLSQSFTITLTATDNGGSTGSASTSVTVNDRAPVVTVSGVSPNPAQTGQTVTVTFSATDPDGTVSSISVDWGDGSGLDSLSGSATSDSHSYVSPGSYTITVSAADNSGSVGSNTTSEMISSPLAPSVSISGVTPNPAGTGTTVTVSFSVSSTLPVTVVTVDWGDGSGLDVLPGSATSDTHIYSSTGNAKSLSFTITVSGSNSAGTGSATTSETVNDGAPVVTITGLTPNPASTGVVVTVNFTYTDSDGTISSVTVNWGDGIVDNAALSAHGDTHAYSSTGNAVSKTFTITVTATDNSGSIGSGVTSATVNDRAPLVIVTGVSPSAPFVGQTATVSFTSSDSDGSIASISVSWGDGTSTHVLAGTATSDTHAYSAAGSFTITVVATDNSGSTSQAVASVTTAVSIAPPYALVVTANGQVYKMYQNGTLTLIGTPVTTPLRQVAWKSDGSYALIVGDFAVLLKYDGTSLTTISTPISTGYNFWSVSWKPDGSYALIGGSVGILLKYDGVSVTQISNPAGTTILWMSWNPSGSYIVMAGKSGGLRTYDGTTIRSFTTGTTNDLNTVAWNPNGQYALIGGLSGVVLSFDGTAVTAINTAGLTGTNAIKAIAFSPSGSLALLVGDNGMVLTWNGSSLTLLPTITSSWLYNVAWGPGGTAYIVGGSGAVLTYSNGTLAKVTTSPATTNQYRGIAWKPQ